MGKLLPLYVRIALIFGAVSVIVIASSQEPGFREKLLDYIDDHALTGETLLHVSGPGNGPLDDMYDPFSYRAGDWEEYIIAPRYRDLDDREKRIVLHESDEVRINTYGSLSLDLLYGKSMFTRKRYQASLDDKPVSKVIQDGFTPRQELQLHVEGTVGDRMTVYIDHDSRKKDNRYYFKYRALRDDELIRELNAGDIDINFQGSKYAVYDNNTAKGLGVDLTLQKNRFTFKAFGSVTRGNTEIEIFRGNSIPGSVKLAEFQYVKGVYYQIEPYIRYDGHLAPPYPSAYSLKAVQVNPYGFEIYMDDQNPYNNQSSVSLPVYGGRYVRMQSGVDYKINYMTGLVEFLNPLPDKARVFAVYNLAATSTDPYALLPGDPRHPGGSFAGKIFVFLKYGYTLEDSPVPGQDHTKQDIYEVRSFYFIGDRNILPDNFSLRFFQENGVMTQKDVQSLGRYSVNYSGGLIEFIYREPFRELLQGSGDVTKIYTEHQPVNVYDYSRYRIKLDYYREARSFQLKHMNVIPDSVTVKVDGRTIAESRYTVDYTAGHISFNSPNDPLIGPETIIEIRYEYLPPESQQQEFVGGFRSEYEVSRDLKIGGSLLYSRTGGEERIPVVGSEPTQTVFVEGDATLKLDGRRLAKVANLFAREKMSSVPVEIGGYAEYARSYKQTNTFGKGLVDNMESVEEVLALSMSERDWILSSPPAGVSSRSLLDYYYFRNPVSPGTLKGIEYLSAAPKIDYSLKPGPFNVAFGHVVHSILSLSAQISLVLDFTSEGDYASIVTRTLPDGPIDLSGVQYVEFSYLYDGTQDVDLGIDVGKVNEDSDGDGTLDTEDVNYNGILDYDPRSGYTEDMGYAFNESGHPATRIGGGVGFRTRNRGDGVLNSEDLNGNGTLDTIENVFSFHGERVHLDSSRKGWQTARIYIDRTQVTPSDSNVLKDVEAVRLYVLKNNGDAGRVYIDGIKFVSSKWREARVDAGPASPDEMKVTSINSIDDREYGTQAFSIMMRDQYKSMYGVENDRDLIKERETALKIEYGVPAGSSSVSVTRRFPKPMDFRNYQTLTAWLNFRNFLPGDEVGILIGSSDTDYIVFKMKMDYPRVWREMKMRLRNGSGGYVFPSSVSGMPDLKRISVMKIVIFSHTPPSSGSIWVNEIYLEEPMVQEDSAHWYEGELKVTRPFYRTKNGMPVMSDFHVKYINKGHGAKFSTIGKKDQDIAEEFNQVFSSFTILPNWNVKIDYIREDSKTDSLNEEVEEARRGKTSKNSMVFATDYTSEMNAVPSIRLHYKYDDYMNRLDERIDDYDVRRDKNQVTHAPVLHYRQEIDRFLWGRLTNDFMINLVFKREEIRRKSAAAIEDIAEATSFYELEKRQRSEIRYLLDYTNKWFYLRPEVIGSSEEVVTWLGKSESNSTELLYVVRGDYHFPFVYDRDCRFVERNKSYSLTAGLGDFTYLAPEYRVDIQYFENRFRDFDVTEVFDSGYRRERDARTLLSTNIDVPVYLHKIKALRSVRAFTLNYNRSLYMSETKVPYEGEKRGSLDEKYGMKRPIGGLADAGFNIFRYYPFCFFMGRHNYARGRDYLYSKMNKPIVNRFGKVVQDYDNSLRLLDNFSAAWSLDLDRLTVTSNSGLHQVCERQNLFGIPSQVITANTEVNVNIDLMRFFTFWFFRPNREGIPYHAAFLTAGYRFDINQLITQNLEERVHTPNAGLSFKRDRASLGFNFGVNIKDRESRPYISFNGSRRSWRDYQYFLNMPQYALYKERDLGYIFTAILETDVMWIYKFFSLFYTLSAFPVYTLEYSMKINRYDYTYTIQPEPYDLHLISSRLSLDLHKNIRGGLSARFALEQYRNQYTNNIKREIISFEFGANLTILF